MYKRPSSLTSVLLNWKCKMHTHELYSSMLTSQEVFYMNSNSHFAHLKQGQKTILQCWQLDSPIFYFIFF